MCFYEVLKSCTLIEVEPVLNAAKNWMIVWSVVYESCLETVHLGLKLVTKIIFWFNNYVFCFVIAAID